MKTLPVLLTLLALVLMPSLAYAEHGDAAHKPGMFDIIERSKEAKGALEARHETLKEDYAERTEAAREAFNERRANFASTTKQWKASFTEKVKELITLRANHVAHLLDGMLIRLTTIADRIDARIDDLEASGEDAAAAKAALVDARAELITAEAAIDDVKEALSNALASETPRDEVKETVKPLVRAAKEALRAAHESLMTSARLLPKKEATI